MIHQITIVLFIKSIIINEVPANRHERWKFLLPRHTRTVPVYTASRTGIDSSHNAFCCCDSKDAQVVVVCSHIQVLSI